MVVHMMAQKCSRIMGRCVVLCCCSGAFVHARLLSDNLEINNPMYLAGDDEPDHHHHHHVCTHTLTNSHFMQIIYASLNPQLIQFVFFMVLLRYNTNFTIQFSVYRID